MKTSINNYSNFSNWFQFGIKLSFLDSYTYSYMFGIFSSLLNVSSFLSNILKEGEGEGGGGKMTSSALD